VKIVTSLSYKFRIEDDNIRIKNIIIPRDNVYLPYIKINGEHILIIDKEIKEYIIFTPVEELILYEKDIEINNIKKII